MNKLRKDCLTLARGKSFLQGDSYNTELINVIQDKIKNGTGTDTYKSYIKKTKEFLKKFLDDQVDESRTRLDILTNPLIESQRLTELLKITDLVNIKKLGIFLASKIVESENLNNALCVLGMMLCDEYVNISRTSTKFINSDDMPKLWNLFQDNLTSDIVILGGRSRRRNQKSKRKPINQKTKRKTRKNKNNKKKKKSMR